MYVHHPGNSIMEKIFLCTSIANNIKKKSIYTFPGKKKSIHHQPMVFFLFTVYLQFTFTIQQNVILSTKHTPY